MRAFARDPNFVIDDQILKRYAGVSAPRRLANDELVVIMMASAMRADLARVMRETWLRAHPHVLIVGDAENASVPVRLPAPQLSSAASLRGERRMGATACTHACHYVTAYERNAQGGVPCDC